MSETLDLLSTGPSDAAAHLILAHGAGAPMDSDFMDAMAALLADRQVAVLRFEFPYMAERRATGKRKPPNRMPILLEAWRTAIQQVVDTRAPRRLAIGGKSMGGRAASLLLAEGDAPKVVSGRVTLGYPFHPPGKPEKTRTDHFGEIAVPTVMVQGTRDPFGTRDDVAGYRLPNGAQVFWCEDGDHDLKPRKASGRTHDQALGEAADAVAGFLLP